MRPYLLSGILVSNFTGYMDYIKKNAWEFIRFHNAVYGMF